MKWCQQEAIIEQTQMDVLIKFKISSPSRLAPSSWSMALE
jgi:hypothetical protein